MSLSLRPFALALVIAGGSLWAGSADARDPEECQLKWGQAVRSYLTQNRTKGPEDKVFAAACTLEGEGKKDEARVEAVLIGARELSKLDARGCVRFMESYVGSSRPKDVCDLAAGGDEGALRKAITDSMPPRPSKK
ncbi:hypothetical protein L6R52_40395 [Myxococcota bacterium]|nr:hypothetical protein [Myxococcota bacterium]